MQTLIELYDERPLENVLGVEVFRPERVVYVCPDDFHDEKRIRAKLEAYFRHRGLTPELVFARARVYETEAMLTLFRGIVRQYPDCALDITGGTDAVLFAAGLLSAVHGGGLLFDGGRLHARRPCGQCDPLEIPRRCGPLLPSLSQIPPRLDAHRYLHAARLPGGCRRLLQAGGARGLSGQGGTQFPDQCAGRDAA